ncbi:MAG TPA: hypothetical protein VMV91_06510 [Rhodocyclaceae bacterium]|nr:hypothetical protein [Rhodocyclaceae bacterium]
MNTLLADPFLDCALWQRMLDGESAPAPSGAIGLLRREDFSARNGRLLVLQGGGASARAYLGDADADVAVLLVLGDEAVPILQAQGWAAVRTLVRRGELHPYMLKTLRQLEEAGLADFVEDLGLSFPQH